MITDCLVKMRAWVFQFPITLNLIDFDNAPSINGCTLVVSSHMSFGHPLPTAHSPHLTFCEKVYL